MGSVDVYLDAVLVNVDVMTSGTMSSLTEDYKFLEQKHVT